MEGEGNVLLPEVRMSGLVIICRVVAMHWTKKCLCFLSYTFFL